MFLVLNHYEKPEEVDLYLKEHRAFLDVHYASQALVFSGRRKPPIGGVVLFNLSDVEEVQKIMAQDPFFVNGVTRFEIIEFVPNKYDPRFEPFIKNE